MLAPSGHLHTRVSGQVVFFLSNACAQSDFYHHPFFPPFLLPSLPVGSGSIPVVDCGPGETGSDMILLSGSFKCLI